MISIVVGIALHLLVVHTVDGREVVINQEQVTSLTSNKKGAHSKLLTEGARCLIGLTDGKFVTVAEDCESIKRQME